MSNTTNPSRRAILTGIPAAAIGVGATSSVAFALLDDDSHLIALGKELETSWAREKAAEDLLTSESGDLTGGAWDTARARCEALVDEIETLQARTLSGLKVKALAASWTHCGDEFWPEALSMLSGSTQDERLACSIIRDLLTINI